MKVYIWNETAEKKAGHLLAVTWKKINQKMYEKNWDTWTLVVHPFFLFSSLNFALLFYPSMAPKRSITTRFDKFAPILLDKVNKGKTK